MLHEFYFNFSGLETGSENGNVTVTVKGTENETVIGRIENASERETEIGNSRRKKRPRGKSIERKRKYAKRRKKRKKQKNWRKELERRKLRIRNECGPGRPGNGGKEKNTRRKRIEREARTRWLKKRQRNSKNSWKTMMMKEMILSFISKYFQSVELLGTQYQ